MSSCWHLNDTAWQSVRLKALKLHRLMQGHNNSKKKDSTYYIITRILIMRIMHSMLIIIVKYIWSSYYMIYAFIYYGHNKKEGE